MGQWRLCAEDAEARNWVDLSPLTQKMNKIFEFSVRALFFFSFFGCCSCCCFPSCLFQINNGRLLGTSGRLPCGSHTFFFSPILIFAAFQPTTRISRFSVSLVGSWFSVGYLWRQHQPNAADKRIQRRAQPMPSLSLIFYRLLAYLSLLNEIN